MIRCLSALSLAVVAAGPIAAQEFDCLMDPAEVIELASPVSGLLSEVLVNRGDRLVKGQVVARLNSVIEETTVDLLRVRANSPEVIEAQERQLDMVRKRYDRVQQLRARGISTEDAFNQVEAELIAAESNLFQAELNQDIAAKELARAEIALDQRTIVSPVDGFVAERTLTGGEYVGTDDHVIRIVRLDPLKVEAFLPVSLFHAVAVGDVATVHPAPPLDGAHSATITAVDRVFDAASATFVVELDLPNPDGALPAGHRCTLSLGTG